MSPTEEWVLGLFGKSGYFVEAGAHDGVGDSQTLALEQAGWQGLLVEPSSWGASLSQNRRCSCSRMALGDGEVHEFIEVLGGGVELSGLADKFQSDGWNRRARSHSICMVRTQKLHDLLTAYSAPGTIEFLALDTEGSELSILQHHDFDKHTFLAVQVEHNRIETRCNDLRSFMESKGYKYAGDDGVNYRFLLRS